MVGIIWKSSYFTPETSKMAGGWVPFKELSHVVRWAISCPEPGAHFALEDMLKKHRPDFISLLQNPVREWMRREI